MAERGKSTRRQEILEALALMLESSNHQRITTSALARQVGFSEAALYKHFPSKARMYEGLLDFTEEALFSRINAIARESRDAVQACNEILLMTLTFAERNPGITRLICGDALHGESERLQNRAGKVFQRLNSDIKQMIKVGEIRDALRTAVPHGIASAMLVNVIEGRMHQYVRSRFEEKPTANWSVCWPAIAAGLFLT